MASWTDDARRFLEAHRLGHLATVAPDGTPHVLPVCYALDDHALYFVADAKPKRRPAHALQRLVNVRATGQAALARLRARYPQYRPMALEDRVAHPIVRIAPLSVTTWRASETR